MGAVQAGDWVRNTRTGLVRQVIEARATEIVVGLPLAWGTRIWSTTEVEPAQAPT